MFKYRNFHILFGAFLSFTACERREPSPVEIKLDENYEYTSFQNLSSEKFQNIKEEKQTKNSNILYTTIEGETVFNIADKLSIDPMTLIRMNGLRPPYKIITGQNLILPENIGEKSSTKNSNEQQDENQQILGILNTSEDTGTVAKNIPLSTQNLPLETSDILLGTAAKAAKILSVPKINSSNKDIKSKKETEKIAIKEVSTKKIKNNKMIFPVNGKIISKFGEMLDGIPNDGINIAAKEGTEVQSVSNGVVIYTGNKLDEEFGNVVIVQHNNGTIASYAHLQKINVKNNEQVNTGKCIGTVGKTGDVSKPQLHFEIMKDKKPVNPNKYLTI